MQPTRIVVAMLLFATAPAFGQAGTVSTCAQLTDTAPPCGAIARPVRRQNF